MHCHATGLCGFILLLLFLQGFECSTEYVVLKHGKSETITSPHYPKAVTQQAQATWFIKASGADKITCQFVDFNLSDKGQGDGRCTQQKLVLLEDVGDISTGDMEYKRITYCGEKLPPAYVSRGSELTLTFEADRAVGDYKFLIRCRVMTTVFRSATLGHSLQNPGLPSQRMLPSIDDAPAQRIIGIPGPVVKNGKFLGRPNRHKGQIVTSPLPPPGKSFRLPHHVRTLLCVLAPIVGAVFALILMRKLCKKIKQEKRKDKEEQRVVKTVTK